MNELIFSNDRYSNEKPCLACLLQQQQQGCFTGCAGGMESNCPRACNQGPFPFPMGFLPPGYENGALGGMGDPSLSALHGLAGMGGLAGMNGLGGMGGMSGIKEKIDKRYHIKKPLNAFMLFMKEQRSKVMSESSLKESAQINQLLGISHTFCFSASFIAPARLLYYLLCIMQS